MDLGVVMSREVLADKVEGGRGGRHRVATWNTRRVPQRLTPGWTNRLFVACGGRWRGSFPLAGEVGWNPADAAAPYALIFDPRRWTPIPAVQAPRFRGWRYLDSPPGGEATSAARLADPGGIRQEVLPEELLEEDARLSAGAPSPTGRADKCRHRP
jgi:hypothetical protein